MARPSRYALPVNGLVPPHQARKILVVDDNEDAAEMLSEALRIKGHETRVAHDAPSALRLAEGFTPDIAFLDIGLPVMDGYELAGRLRELPGLRGIRLVAVTGYGQESDRRRSQAAGFHHHLVKPVDFEAVDGVVNGDVAGSARSRDDRLDLDELSLHGANARAEVPADSDI